MFPDRKLVVKLLLGFSVAYGVNLSLEVPDALAEKVTVGWVTEVSGNHVKIKKTKSYMADEFTFDEKTKMFFHGFKGIGQNPKVPGVGYGVKVRVGSNGGRAAVISMMPPLKPSKLIENRLQMSHEKLFEAVDENQDQRIDIVEYTTYLLPGKRSPKHFPGVFCGQWDKNNDEVLSLEEFIDTVQSSPQYRLKQKSAADWMKLADKNGDGEIDSPEFIKTIPAGGHKEKYVNRLDKDGSGGLSIEELQAYIVSE